MPAFIEECRYEWKRLGVPDSMAEEMATELEADLAEAQADGVSAAELLGESDPRRFAANWASERGLVSVPPPKKSRKRLWIGLAVALVVLVFVGLPALAFIGSGSTSAVSSGQPIRSLVIPNVIGMKACKAVRRLARSGADDWRVAGHQHGYTCDLLVAGQSPTGRVIRRDGHPVIVTLRLGRS
jgi:uncharacterized membrane-anchored protein